MHRAGLRYVGHVNRFYGRTGTLFEGRFRSSLVQTERYLLTCMRYIELNPVRARMVVRPGDYRWSSFRSNAGLAPQSWLVPHDDYLRLGRSAPERVEAYRALFRTALDPEDLAAIRLHATTVVRSATRGFRHSSRRWCAAARMSRRSGARGELPENGPDPFSAYCHDD